MRFLRQLVEEVHTDTVDLVVDVETSRDCQLAISTWERRRYLLPFDVFPMIFHDNVYKIIDRRFERSVNVGGLR